MSLRETKSMVVWIDAVCINQWDMEEKGWQVRLMGDIYQQAFGVLAWLGAATDSSDTVIDYLNVLGKKAEACGLHLGPGDCLEIWQAMMTTPSYMNDSTEVVLTTWLDGKLLQVSKHALKSLLDSISGWESQDQLLPTADLNRLVRRAWWGRVWVLQEIALPNRAYFACGTKRIHRRTFRAAFNAYYALWNTLASSLQQQQSLTAYQSEIVFMATHKAHVMLSMSNVYRMERFPLVALLRATCVGSVHHLQQDGYQHLESTDQRDKIFALLGLASDRQELETLGVFPDYTRSKQEIYMVTMAALLRQGHISIFSLCRASETSSDLPSWAPDWSLPMPETLQDVQPDHITLYPRFNASGSSSQDQLNISTNIRQLEETSIMANIYEKIRQIGDVPRIPDTGTCIFPIHWLYEILRLTYESKDIYADFTERLQAVVRASHTSTGYGGNTKVGRVNRFFDALPIFKRGIRDITRRDIRVHLWNFLTSQTVKALLKSKCAVPARLINDFMRITPKRSPFVTEKGHIGISSQQVRQGDIVALIGGAQVPFVLRRRGNGRYTIVSEAYVDGIMDGEAARDGSWEQIKLV